MTTRMKPITPYNSASSPASKREKGTSVKVKANMAPVRNSGIEDNLHAALGQHKPTLPSDNHIWTHTTRVEPIGAHYGPHGEYGSRQRMGGGRGVYSYGGAPNTKGTNANGSSPSNKKGGNALGQAMNKVGTNSVGSPPNRKGGNANMSKVPNKTGQKSGYPGFRPRGGGKNV